MLSDTFEAIAKLAQSLADVHRAPSTPATGRDHIVIMVPGLVAGRARPASPVPACAAAAAPEKRRSSSRSKSIAAVAPLDKLPDKSTGGRVTVVAAASAAGTGSSGVELRRKKRRRADLQPSQVVRHYEYDIAYHCFEEHTLLSVTCYLYRSNRISINYGITMTMTLSLS